MAQDIPPVKPTLFDWIDHHPRSGWYLCVWALIVTSNTLFEWLDRILSWLT